MMNTGAIIQDLIDWIDNHLIAVWILTPLPDEPAIRSGTCSGSSKNIPGSPSENIFGRKSCKSRSNA
ncbi:right origin-binding protein [Klebsiella pneumoniae]|uniref:Right origin-binding protein n=1 Tax=Klebsiella pneumoniae TaxID=573 RepID=A0A377WMN0_KLEPN|nr:right origin-binding protein [Klebsiella pneumoniae]